MKEKYVRAELELILFNVRDVITASDPSIPDDTDNSIGGSKVDSNGWT